MRDWGDCDRCGKKDVSLIDGLCIECASERKNDKQSFSSAILKTEYEAAVNKKTKTEKG